MKDLNAKNNEPATGLPGKTCSQALAKKQAPLALVTGASSGIGQDISLKLAQAGYEVWLHGRNLRALESLEKTLQQKNSVWLADFQNPSEVEQLGQQLVTRLQQEQRALSLLVNNAGIFATQHTQDQNHASYQTQWQINFFAPVVLTQTLVPFMKAPASILNISSTLGLKGVIGTGAYGASKAAMIHWTQTLALELGPIGIRANVICPGLVDTPIHAFHHLPPTEKLGQIEKLNSRQPLQRIGQCQDISQAVLFLASTEAQWITGAQLNVDGGIHLT